MSTNLESLSRKLLVSQIDFKVSQLNKWSDQVFATLLAYKDARTDMEMLDECVGKHGWQNEYKRDSQGILQCGIGIYCEMGIGNNAGDQQWVWKWSNGVPSQFQKEKGEYSDAFKRAGFMWGIGRDLYDFPDIKIALMDNEWKEEGGKPKATGYLKPNKWHWEIAADNSQITATQKIKGKKCERFNLDPYKKKS